MSSALAKSRSARALRALGEQTVDQPVRSPRSADGPRRRSTHGARPRVEAEHGQHRPHRRRRTRPRSRAPPRPAPHCRPAPVSCTTASARGTARSSSIACRKASGTVADRHAGLVAGGDPVGSPMQERLDPFERLGRVVQRFLGVLDRRPVMDTDQVIAQRDRPGMLGDGRHRQRCCPATSTSSRRTSSPNANASSTGRNRHRSRAIARPRSRGAERSDPVRRRGCRIPMPR